MGLFRNKKGAIPEILGNPQASAVPPPAKISQEFPVAQQTALPANREQAPSEQAPKQIPSISSGAPAQSAAGASPGEAEVTKELSVNTKPRGDQPFFVRIDKFNETVENFRKVYDQLHNIEKIIESLESTKDEEEKELAEWKKDVSDMKNNLNKIDNEIFNKI